MLTDLFDEWHRYITLSRFEKVSWEGTKVLIAIRLQKWRYLLAGSVFLFMYKMLMSGASIETPRSCGESCFVYIETDR